MAAARRGREAPQWERRVVGPGHNSIATGPDGLTDFIVYHAWDEQLHARKLCVDELRWTPDGPQCDGPIWTEQKVSLG